MLCIICLTEKDKADFSEEHVFPEAIGGTFKINNVCSECNSKLGSDVDCHLTDHFIVQMNRLALRIGGKSGSVPNPIDKGTLSDDPNQKLVYILDAEGNPQSLYVVPNIEREKRPDGTEVITIKMDVRDKEKLPEVLNKIRIRAGLAPLPVSEIEKHMKKESIPEPWMKIRRSMNSLQYKRGILKIAYELACTWLGDDYLSDPTSKLIRECMLDNDVGDDWDKKYPVNGKIEFCANQLMFPVWQHDEHSHIAFMIKCS